MRWPYRIALALLGLHLVVVILGAASRVPDPTNRALFALRSYAAITGAGAGYGFFAPGVSSQFRAEFDVISPDGSKQTLQLLDGVNREAEIRMGNMFSKLWTDPDDTKLRRSLTASWAGRVFHDHPGAQKVVVRVDSYWLPDPREYLAGERPQWEEFYRVAYTRKPRLLNEGS